MGFRDPAFWRYFALVVALSAGALSVGVLLARLQRWDFDECARVGHTAAYCAFNYPIGAH